MELPCKYQLEQQVFYKHVPRYSNPCTVISVTFWGQHITYGVVLNQDPSGHRHNLTEEDLEPVTALGERIPAPKCIRCYGPLGDSGIFCEKCREEEDAKSLQGYC